MVAKTKPLGIPDSPWLTTDEAARYLRFPSLRAFYRWLEFNDLPCGRRGRIRLFERRVLDDFVRGERWTKRRAHLASPQPAPQPMQSVTPGAVNR